MTVEKLKSKKMSIPPPDLMQAQQALAHAIAQANRTPQHCKLLSTFARPTARSYDEEIGRQSEEHSASVCVHTLLLTMKLLSGYERSFDALPYLVFIIKNALVAVQW